MGRLFWKFFLAFWLSQLVTMIGVGIAVDLKHQSERRWLTEMNQRLGKNADGTSRNDFRQPPDTGMGPAREPMRDEQRFADRERRDPRYPREFGGAADHAERPGGPAPFSSYPADGPRFSPPPPHMGFDSPRLFFIPLEPLLAGLAVSLVFAATLAWLFSRPIRSLREGFTSLSAGKLDTRLGAILGKRNDEFGDLGRAFDGMASTLGDLMAAQKRLLHDVSHELRSPLARLQAATGLARQQPEKLDVSMSRIEREAQRMDRLIDELLTLSRLEIGSQPPQFEEINLGDLLEGIIADARFEATEAELEIKLIGDSALLLRCQPALLHRAIENLVRNAIKYSPPHSTVSVYVENPGPDYFALRIEDEGPGIPEEDLESIFEPFVRGRSSQTIAGYGLGLAIARSVIEAHKGYLVASNRTQGGLCVRVALPKNLIVA